MSPSRRKQAYGQLLAKGRAPEFRFPATKEARKRQNSQNDNSQIMNNVTITMNIKCHIFITMIFIKLISTWIRQILTVDKIFVLGSGCFHFFLYLGLRNSPSFLPTLNPTFSTYPHLLYTRHSRVPRQNLQVTSSIVDPRLTPLSSVGLSWFMTAETNRRLLQRE